MAEISFYHCAGETPAAADAALSSLLEKALKNQMNVLVLCPTEARCARLDETLWTYAESAFLPHATLNDTRADAQPVLLGHTEIDWQKHLAKRLPVVLAGAEQTIDNMNENEKILYLFTAANADVTRARPLFKSLKEKGHTMAYYQQTDKGWTKK